MVPLTKPVACYVRVSTENQLENYSIDEQIVRLKAFCTARGWTIFNIYTDGGYSGGNTNRPALQKLLEDIQSGVIGAVVVYKLDRLSRSQKDTLTLIEDQFLAHGVDFVSVNENFDTSTPFGRAMIGILSVFAQLEKDQITERFMMGRIGRAKSGLFHGGPTPPVGYNYVDGKLIVNDFEAAQVREIYSRFLSGESMNSIRRNMQRQYGVWQHAVKVYNVLRNTVYLGQVKFSGKTYAGAHEPIISVDIFDAVHQLLNNPGRSLNFTAAQKTPFRAGYLLSSLVFCARCGARYSANHGYYKCYSRAKSSQRFVTDPNCKNENWLLNDLDDHIIQEIHSVAENPDLAFTLPKSSDEADPGMDVARVKSHLKDLDSQISRLIELYQLDGAPISIISEKIKALDQEKQGLLRMLETESKPKSENQHRFLDALSAFQADFDDAPTEARRLMVSSLIKRIEIDGTSIRVFWRV